MPQIVSSLFVSFFMMLWIVRATGTLSATAVLFLLAFPWVCFMLGDATIRSLRLSRLVYSSFSIRFLLGFIFLGVILLNIRRFSSMDIRMPFLFIAIGAFAWHGTITERRKAIMWGGTNWIHVLALNLALIGASFSIPCLVNVHSSSSLGVWPGISQRSYLVDVEIINLLASESPISVLGQPGLAQIPVSLSNSAGFVVDATFNAFTGFPIVETLVAIGYPLSMLALLLGVSSLFESWVDTRFSIYGLLLIVILLFLTSESITYIGRAFVVAIDHRTAYGIGVGAVSVLFFTRGLSRGNVAGMALGAFLTVLTGLFHKWVAVTSLVTIIFFVPCWFLISRGDQRNRATRNRQYVSARLIVALFLAGGLLTLQLLWMLTNSGGNREISPLSYHEELPQLASQSDQNTSAPPLVISIFAFVCGVIVVARKNRHQKWRPLVGVAVIAYAWYAVNLLLLRTPGFSLPSTTANVSAGWIGILLAFLAGGLIFQFMNDVLVPFRRHELSILIAAIALLGVVCGLRLRFDDAQTLSMVAELLPKGLRECALHIRDHSNAIDRIQDSEDDPTSIVEAITQRRQYVGFASIDASLQNQSLAEIFSRRRDEHRQWRRLANLSELIRVVRIHGIRWYLLHPATPVSWPAAVQDACVLERDGYRVYDFRRLTLTD